ncbi:MAG: hypothetical protein KKE44_09440 [Proteobacteria bacterium]|nr:hypothetical protein [Pseudomonadota bacterium]MBU1582948.1 hypothetical protein [Pseudomonadota bacterium]MBU2452746.1 hypothetical protein [Pseudomonadota bacterium]MBU2630130.1 hypothetical protein [Pseudomonadota bacterium]
MTTTKDFGNIAVKLAKNPLGIIALFQVLIYGIAGYVMSNLESAPLEILKIFIWFLVGFPVIVLFVFFILVVFHHTKLYAPSDFSDEANFMASFEKSIKESKTITDLEKLTKHIKQQIDSHPMFVFARLPISLQLLIKKAYLEKEIDIEKDNTYAAVSKEIDLLESQYQWIEIKENKVILTEKGKSEIGGFIELTIPRYL